MITLWTETIRTGFIRCKVYLFMKSSSAAQLCVTYIYLGIERLFIAQSTTSILTTTHFTTTPLNTTPLNTTPFITTRFITARYVTTHFPSTHFFTTHFFTTHFDFYLASNRLQNMLVKLSDERTTCADPMNQTQEHVTPHPDSQRRWPMERSQNRWKRSYSSRRHLHEW